ncbi:hypothetical protein D3C72_2201620 [compost metagenome]
MAGIGSAQPLSTHKALPALRGLAQFCGKVEVTRLETGRIGVGNVVGQHLLALGTQPQRQLMHAQCTVELVDHAGDLRAQVKVIQCTE